MRSRKFWLTVFVILISFIYAWFKVIGEQTLATIVIGVLTLYMAGNVTDKKLNGDKP